MKQGDIILLDFDPVKGREQAGYRPAVIISASEYNAQRNLIWVCPITNTVKDLRFHVHLDNRTKTKGDIICEQVRTIDILARKCRVVEQLPKDLLEQTLEIVSVICS